MKAEGVKQGGRAKHEVTGLRLPRYTGASEGRGSSTRLLFAAAPAGVLPASAGPRPGRRAQQRSVLTVSRTHENVFSFSRCLFLGPARSASSADPAPGTDQPGGSVWGALLDLSWSQLHLQVNLAGLPGGERLAQSLARPTDASRGTAVCGAVRHKTGSVASVSQP